MEAPACAFVIMGITGDLAARKLLPALYALHEDGKLHPHTRVIGYGRSSLSDGELRSRLKDAVAEHADRFCAETWERLAPRLSYVQGRYGGSGAFDGLRQVLEGLDLPGRLFYTATPPSTYAGISAGLIEAGLNRSRPDGWTRLVIEKPFGHDLESARELNRQLAEGFSEGQLYRIDHYLGKETAQNVAALRFANALFEPTWNSRFVDHVQITMTEDGGLEGRGSFYEEAGVLRDVFQNHLLQLLALVAMEPPAQWEARSVRNEKVKVLEAASCTDPRTAVFGQYTAGNGLPAYTDEDGVAPGSEQATFAAACFGIRNWRWNGVPFYVRAGKGLARKATEIVLHYRVPPHVPFSDREGVRADRLVLRLAPDEGIDVVFNVKKPGGAVRFTPARLNFSYAGEFGAPNPDAYETLLLDALRGDATLFMREDEVETQWEIITPLLAAAAAAGAPEPYAAGSEGPAGATDLLERTGRSWHAPGGNA